MKSAKRLDCEAAERSIFARGRVVLMKLDSLHMRHDLNVSKSVVELRPWRRLKLVEQAQMLRLQHWGRRAYASAFERQRGSAQQLRMLIVEGLCECTNGRVPR